MEIGSVMSKRIVSLAPEATAVETGALMREEKVGCVLLLDKERKPIGIVTDRDLAVRVIARGRNPAATRVEEVMSRHPFTVSRDEPVMLVARQMADKQVRRVPVVDENGAVVGLVSVDDLLTIFITELFNVSSIIVGSSRLVR